MSFFWNLHTARLKKRSIHTNNTLTNNQLEYHEGGGIMLEKSMEETGLIATVINDE